MPDRSAGIRISGTAHSQPSLVVSSQQLAQTEMHKTPQTEHSILMSIRPQNQRQKLSNSQKAVVLEIPRGLSPGDRPRTATIPVAYKLVVSRTSEARAVHLRSSARSNRCRKTRLDRMWTSTK